MIEYEELEKLLQNIFESEETPEDIMEVINQHFDELLGT